MKAQTLRAHIPARIGAALAVLAAASLLVGCATPLTPEQNLKKFGAGEVTTYVIVAGPPKNMAELLQRPSYRAEVCDGVGLADVAKPLRPWYTENYCTGDRARQWQSVPGVYYTSVFGGIQSIRAGAPADWKIEVDDILEISGQVSPDGTQTRHALVKRIARKAKDATKASGCYWDGGKGWTSGVVTGGAVCDGWNWRDQKWAR
jgi:hypothetical protein